MSQPPQPSPTDTLKRNGYAAAMIIPLALVLFVYERALVPLYASSPTSYMLKPTIITAAVLAAVDPVAIPVSWNWLLLGLALTIAPNANYWVAVWTGRYGKPLSGAATTHATVLFPLAFLFFTAATNGVLHQVAGPSTPSPLNVSRPDITQRVVQVGIVYYMATSLSQDLLPVLPFFSAISESHIYLGLASIFWLAWIFTSSLFSLPEKNAPSTPTAPIAAPKAETKGKKTKKGPAPEPTSTSTLSETSPAISPRAMIAAMAFSAIFTFAQPLIQSPVLPHPLKTPYTYPDGSFRVLSAEQSVTGLITVVDWLPGNDTTNPMHSARYLRASHSILGGVWTHDKVMLLDQDNEPLKDLTGFPLGDSIYSTFVLQEGLRLVNSHKKVEKALVIGLGIGTSASSLMRHGVDTTIVEIDPAVYKAATTYFGLPNPGEDKVFLQDARAWVASRKECVKEGKCDLFDAAIHDCFSGGGVPEHIFTLEFWNDLKSIMHPNGVLVLNFAGIVNSESTKLVLNTLLESFGQCRAFHDHFNEFTEQTYNEEFLNMVLFCTSPEDPLTFRKSRTSDYLSSPLRRHILSGMEDREVKLEGLVDTTGKYIIMDNSNPLGKLQDAQGAHHWEVMRAVLPNSHWETF